MSPETRCPKGEVPLYTMFFKVLQQDLLYSEVALHWPPQLWWQHQISLCQLLWAHNGTFSNHEMSIDRFPHKNRCNFSSL